MNYSISILVPILALFFNNAFAQLPKGQSQKLYSCDVTKYDGILYSKGNLMGENQWKPADSFERCVEECLMDGRCKAINFVREQSICAILSEGIAGATTSPTLYGRASISAHAYISCPPTKSSGGPVGCGKQAPAYSPTVTRSSKFNRIIGGKEAKPHSWPWLVTLSVDFRNGYGAGCGASLIRVKDGIEKSDIIVTAAHCVTKEDTMSTKPQAFAPDQFTAVAGNHKKDRYDAGEASRQASDVRFHPNFKFTQIGGAQNDLALIKLATPIDFSDTIRPICLPTAGEALPVGKTCVAAGWGRNNSKTGDTADNLQQVLAPAQDANTCKRGWGPSYNQDMMICAGSMRGDSGTCQGDSGGMLACQQSGGAWTLYGATSFGVAGSCLENGKPAVFTRISSYMDWVIKNVKEMSSL
jgi:hypothetical protein